MNGKRRAAGPATTKTTKPARTRKQKLARVGKWALLLGLVGALLGAGTFVALYQVVEIPDPNEDFQTETSFVFYNDGKTELGRFAKQDRTSIPLSEMPQHLQDAVVAAENQSFWTDRGIDPKGIVRAAFSNAKGGTTQGASTITQQYVKILYLSQEQSYRRKVKEAILSLKIQREKSKKEILEGYLNTIYFGRGAYGVQAAAQAYFDKPASQLDVRESVVLARVLNNPSAYDPANGKDAKRQLKAGYQFILKAMVDTESLGAAEAERAAKRLPKFPVMEAESTYGGQRGHMLELVKTELQRLGFNEEEIDGQGLQVTTTLTQKAMDAVEKGVTEVKPTGFEGERQLHIGAASVEPGTGALRGFYGGQDYLDSQINWAVAGGQGGSTLKAFALAAAIEDGFSLRDTFEGNSPFVLPDGTDVENQGDQDYGSAISMVTATENSVNTAFIDMTVSMENGPQKIIKMANAMGIPPAEAPSRRAPGFPNSTPGLEPQTGVALGSATVSPINMATGYATLANEGVHAEPYVIERIVDRDGNELYQHKAKTQKVLDADIAADVSFALQQVVQEGSGTAALELGRPAAGKTGTATNGKDEVSSAWFAGYTPQMATAVVYLRGKGNEQLQGWLPSYEGREGYFGGNYPARTWTAIMGPLMEGLPVEEFPEPAYVDGDAPTSGHEPYVPPAAPTTRPPAPSGGSTSGGGGGGQPQPSQTVEPAEPGEDQEPTEEPTTEAPPPPPPTTQAPIPTPTLTPSPTPTPTPTEPTPTATTGAPAGQASGSPRRSTRTR